MDVPPEPDDLRERQQALLDRLLAELRAGNPFQQRRLPGEDSPMTLAEFTRRVPFTTKAELVADQAAHPPYGSNLTFPVERYVRCHQTSGTTGRPMRWLDTAESWSAMTDDWADVLRAAGIHRGDRVFVAFSFGPFLGFWLAFEAAARLGCLCLPGGGMSSALRVRVLAENACNVLCCTPTYALHLAEVWRQEGRKPEASPVRTIVVAGEPGGSLPATRQRLMDAWPGSVVFDHHGMTEVGPVTHEVPGSPGNLAVLEGSHLAEVIDPVSGGPVPAGETGELVLTTLRRTGSPLLRYRTGDLVRARRDRGRLVLEGGILGRTDDMLVIRGVNVYPAAVDEVVRGLPGIDEYRVHVDNSTSLAEIRIEAETDRATADELATRLQAALSLRVPVTAVSRATLPRFELKARRWIRH